MSKSKEFCLFGIIEFIKGEDGEKWGISIEG